MSRQKSAGRSPPRCHSLSVCVCVCVRMHMGLPISGSQSGTCSACRKEKKSGGCITWAWVSGSHPFSPPPSAMLHDGLILHTHMERSLGQEHTGEIQPFFTGNKTSSGMVFFLFCIPFKLTVHEDFCRLICNSSCPKCFGIPWCTQRYQTGIEPVFRVSWKNFQWQFIFVEAMSLARASQLLRLHS